MNRRPDRRTLYAWLTPLLLFGLIFLRYCCYGLRYFPQLDDYIQLHNYTAYHPDIWPFMQKLGVLAARPAAGTLDILFWGHMWPVLPLGLALLSALYAASAVLFCRVWKKYFHTGWVFLVLYTLLPLGLEGTYWISAGNRVIPSIFFTALATRLFQHWCETGSRGRLIGCFAAQLAAFSFYEQGLALSVTGVFLTAILEFRDRRSRSLWSLLSFVNVGIYFAFTSAFSDSALYSGRSEIVLPWQPGWLRWVCLPVLRQVGGAFVKGGVYTAVKGFFRGVQLIVSEGHWIWFALTLALCAGLALLSRRDACPGLGGREAAPALLTGFLMALAPVTIFFVLGNPWFSMRGTVASFCGFALMADALIGRLLSRLKNRERVAAVFCAVLALMCSIAAVSEIHDYKATYENDQTVMAAVCAGTGDGRSLPAQGDTLILGIEPSYLEEQNFFFHEHIHGITESRWALTGGLQCVSGWKDFPYVKPLSASVGAEAFAKEEYAALYLYAPADETVYPVTARETEDGCYDLVDAGGGLLGRITAEGLDRSEP